MEMTPLWIDILLGVVAILITLFSYYLSIRYKVREAAEGAINAAEELSQIGEEKMAIAVEQIYSMLPLVVKPLFSKAFIEQVIQEVFDSMERYVKTQEYKFK